MTTTATVDTVTPEPTTPTNTESDADISRLAQAWRVDTQTIDVWAGVEAAITTGDESGEFAAYRAGAVTDGEPLPLTKEQEERLARHVERGDKWAREVLANANLRLVTLIAKRYADSGVATEDLIQEGTLGLIHAVDKFDYRRGFRFSTYATHWIRQALGRAVKNQGRTIRLPSHTIDSLGKIKRTREMLATKLNRPPTPAEIADEVGLPVDKVETLLEADSTVSSDDVEAARKPPAPPNPPTAIAAPAPEPPEGDTRALLRETIAELRGVRAELAALRAEVADLRATQRTVPRPSTIRLYPFAPSDRRIEI